MKLRIRSTATKETIRVDVPNSSSLFDLKSLISSNLSSGTPIPPESIHLSLNQTDEITSSPEEHLQSLGLTSGDLLFYSLDSSVNSTPETLNSSQASPVIPFSSASTSASEPPTDDGMEVGSELESESEPFVHEKTASVPCFLRRVMETEKRKIKGNMGLTVVAIHAVFLESGFVACGGGGGSSLPEGCASASHLVSVMYTLPDFISCGNLEDVKNVILKLSAVGNHVSIYGRLVGAQSDIYRLSVDSTKLDPLLASAVNELHEKEQEDIFQLWKTVKDRLSMPLLIDICQKNGLPLPPCFTRLPTDLKIMILEFLPGLDLAKAACTCSELRYLASNDELWKRRFLEEFKLFAAESTGEPWKDKFARSWLKRKKARMERDNALVPYIRTPRIIPMPWIPGAQRFPMIGGDYDRFPAIGDPRSLRRAGFNQHAARRHFSPNCNLGGGGF
ncbi:F-box protein SKIP22-like [Phalaenopsis equestris]|uniref:F-box protein SKIP22-like n=1 Tax=Phalaenopsis equestris TaxID=78828 RepID=UPI0009E33C4A|nr:F-box protein SKIP22-like [Phalaenopsis equestris]